MPTILEEPNHTGEHILSEGNGVISREEITVTGGAKLQASTVLGKLAHGTASAVADAGNTGNGVMGAITLAGGVKAGDYILTVLEAAADAGDFTVEDPDGINIGAGDVGALFDAGGVSFTLADGATDFIAGDRIVITVAEGSGAYVAHDPAATDGSEKAVAILYSGVDAIDADVQGVANVRTTEVIGDSLIWKDGITQQDKDAAIASLAENGIIVR